MGALISMRRRTRAITLYLAVFTVIGLYCIAEYQSHQTSPSLSNTQGTFNSSRWAAVSKGGNLNLMRMVAALRMRPKAEGGNSQACRKSRLNNNHCELPHSPLRFFSGIEGASIKFLEPHDDDIADSSSSFEESMASPDKKHEYNASTGVLTVNPNAPHPIFELSAEAKRRWEKKLSRASKTLKEAVEEYRRRYARHPPRGFDDWWNYVQKHNVRLPDEYDSIFEDLEPYWSQSPADLREAQADREKQPFTYTIGKLVEGEQIQLLNVTVSEPHLVETLTKYGAVPQIDTLREVQDSIPPFRATMGHDDGPSFIRDWMWKDAALKAVKDGRYLEKVVDLPWHGQEGWAMACPPDAPIASHIYPRGQEVLPPHSSTQKTFIHDHRRAMDVCYHPEYLRMHGSFLIRDRISTHRFPPPSLAYCATGMHADIRMTSLAQSSRFIRADQDIPWEERQDTRLFWRGSPTGMWHSHWYDGDQERWRGSQRLRLVDWLSPNAPGMGGSDSRVEYLPSPRLGSEIEERGEAVGSTRSVSRREINRIFMDVEFAGNPINCEGDICESMRQDYVFGNRVPEGKGGAAQYKYLLDVDGNGWSARFRRLMSMDAVVFKSTIYPEWWLERIEPWLHYVPVQMDYSDVYDILTFFAGDLDGEGAHDGMAREIARAGKEWVHEFWRPEDATAYMFRLWLEYARLMSDDRNDMNFILPTL